MLARQANFASGKSVPCHRLSVEFHSDRLPYPQFRAVLGRANRASRDSLDPGRSAISWQFAAGRSGSCGLGGEARYLFTFSRRQAAIGGVQNDLVLPTLLARRRKHLPTLNRRSEAIYLPRISKLVGNRVFGRALSVAPKFYSDRMLNI